MENNIFKRHILDYKKLTKYGFEKSNDIYTIEKPLNDTFKAIIKIDSKGTVEGDVFDLESNDKFLPLKAKNNQGAFVNEIRALYEELLIDIRKNCFIKQDFIYPQTNRIAKFIKQKYKDEPEFLWEKTPGTGVFRNKKSNKWYLVIIDVDYSKIEANKKGLVEVMDIKLEQEQVKELLEQEHYYSAYHMNKKHWITIVLNDSVADEKIIELIEQSYNLTQK